MNKLAFQDYLHKAIPQSLAMQVKVDVVSNDCVQLSAPLAPNINHRNSVFGGSASSVAILSAWSLLYTRLAAQNINATLVIQNNTMSYDAPILGQFEASASLINENDWPRFIKLLLRRGKARIEVQSLLNYDNKTAGRLTGSFVAILSSAPQSE
jgi:thioesterase domain-containing protein